MKEDAIGRRAAEIADVLGQRLDDGTLDSSSLLALHQSFSARFAADNSSIWSTGAIFIPAALAGPVAYFGLTEQRWGELIAFTVSSLLILGAWLVIAENHRAFQNRSIAVMAAIERAMRLDGVLGTPKLPDDRFAARLSRRSTVRNLRRGLPLLLLLFWAVVWITKLVS